MARASTRMSDQVGRVLSGRYRLIAPIGSGASALVYLADDTRLRRRIAVKLLHQGLAEDEGFLRRFRAEAQAAAALNHPNIVAVYDWGEDDGEPYLVTEYLGGGSLRGILDAGHRLTPSQALLVGLEAARALDHAHTRGFVHRDIKPANLLFGEDRRLRIGDFGLARALAEAAWTEPTGAMVGTARYACPEQVRGEPVDGRGDVYSLALVLIESVTGSVPFAADTTISTLMARVDKPIPIPEALGSLRKALARAGEPDATARPDAGELVVGFLAAAEDLPRPEPLPIVGATPLTAAQLVDADPTSVPPTVIAPPPPPPPGGGGPPTVLLGPDAAATESGDLSGRAARKVRRHDKRVRKKAERVASGKRRRWPLVLVLSVVAVALVGAGAYAYNRLAVPSHPLPRLIGLTEAQALEQIEANDWEVNRLEARQDDTAPGEVIAQDPAEGAELDEGKTVTITVSLGNTLRDVPPDLPGRPLEEATAALEAVGLVAGTVTEQADEEVAKGIVIAVDPATPPQLPRDAAVNLIVSSGPAPRTVPSVAPGTTYEAAAAAIEAVQLVPEKVEVFNETIPAGQVVGTDPPGGTEVSRGSTVKVQVSRGPELIPVPDVTNRSVAEAVIILQQAGLSVEGVQGNPARPVLTTDPPAGEPVRRGTEVLIVTRR